MISSQKQPFHLGIMAKYWEPGQVKTRLGATIGMKQSAGLHRVFCSHLARQLADCGARRTFVISPPQRKADFQQAFGNDWEIDLQSDGDLGDRMEHWMRSDDNTNQILIGADCPLISDALIQQAHQALDDHDVVLGPAVDGGYYLIGLRGKWKDEYASLTREIPWSSQVVYELTLHRATQAGLRTASLDVMEDIDTIEELERLKNRLDVEPHESDSLASSKQVRADLRDAILDIHQDETES